MMKNKPKPTNIEMIDRLLEKKPITQFKGELIYNMQDVHKYIDLMPKPTETCSNPIFSAGHINDD